MRQIIQELVDCIEQKASTEFRRSLDQLGYWSRRDRSFATPSTVQQQVSRNQPWSYSHWTMNIRWLPCGEVLQAFVVSDHPAGLRPSLVAIKWWRNMSPHHKCVATLPGEMWIFENVQTQRDMIDGDAEMYDVNLQGKAGAFIVIDCLLRKYNGRCVCCALPLTTSRSLPLSLFGEKETSRFRLLLQCSSRLLHASTHQYHTCRHAWYLVGLIPYIDPLRVDSRI